MDADFAADTAFQVDFAPLLDAFDDAAIDREQIDAIDRANFEARLAAGAVIGVDDRQFLRNLFSRTFFCHLRSCLTKLPLVHRPV